MRNFQNQKINVRKGRRDPLLLHKVMKQDMYEILVNVKVNPYFLLISHHQSTKF